MKSPSGFCFVLAFHTGSRCKDRILSSTNTTIIRGLEQRYSLAEIINRSLQEPYSLLQIINRCLCSGAAASPPQHPGENSPTEL